jgi:hypothetical protein
MGAALMPFLDDKGLKDLWGKITDTFARKVDVVSKSQAITIVNISTVGNVVTFSFYNGRSELVYRYELTINS